jgi:signal transduction histidine kinase
VAVIALSVLLHAVVVVRRRAPLVALVAASALMLALTLVSLPGTPTVAVLLPSSLAYLVMVFTAASSDDRRADAAALAFGLVGAALITLVAVGHETADLAGPGPLIALSGFLVASIAAAWALGRYRRESGRKLAAQAVGREQAAELRLQGERAAVAEERRRIGRELHDVISHSLAVMIAQAEASRVLLGRDDERARTSIEHVVSTGRSAMADMRGLLSVLAEPPADDDAASARRAGDEIAPDAPREPSPGLGDLPELVERAAGVGRTVDLVAHGTPTAVSPGVGLTLYRVVQESLTNSLKHTDPPTRIEVRLDWGADTGTVTVTDDGTPHESRPSGGGRGLRGMRERVEQAGGRFDAGPRRDGGWFTRASLPVGDHDDSEGAG